MQPSSYIYRGIVSLADKPYQETQKGEDGVPRKVWMFPVRLRDTNQALPEGVFKEYTEAKVREAHRLSTAELKKRAQDSGSALASSRNISSDVYIRDAYVSEYAKCRANGICQLCDQKAPFNNRDGEPYLESHYIDWLSKGGSDTIDNTVGLHILNLTADRAKLKQQAKD